jgi:Na+/H+ antiporter NhaC
LVWDGNVGESYYERILIVNSSQPANETRAEFYGGIWAGLVPLGVFLCLVLGLVVLGAPTTEGMIVAAMIGVTAGMFFARDYGVYCERVFSLMANRVATVAIVCWLWAGAFSGVLGMSGLVEAVVWLGWMLGLQGSGFVVVTFVCSAAFAVCVGTGLGTVIGFTAVMYPAGIVLGADPAVILGAIVSGAAFGDNLAPISDTTIVSAATQETDVAGVVKSRLKYVLPCAAISAICFLFVGAGTVGAGDFDADQIIAETANSKGLPMLLPPLFVFLVAIAGYHFLAALAVGIFSACVIGVVFGIFPASELFSIGEGGTTNGALISGAMGLVPTAILTLLLVTAIGILNESGFVDALMKWLDRTIAKTVRGAEAAIVLLTSLMNLAVSVNTVAMITAGPLANELRKRHGIHPYRSANLMDTVSCSFPYILPYSAVTLAAIATQQQVVQRYDFVSVVPWEQYAGYAFYAVLLFPIMIFCVLTGFGRRTG